MSVAGDHEVQFGRLSDSLSNLRALAAKVDAFFARVEGAHAASMQCRSGCHDCCFVRLSVTGVEADLVRAHLAELPEEARAALRADPGGDRCAALDADGRCRIYAARPLVCRSHGMPVRMRDSRSLPVIDSCFRNFGGDASAVPAADVLDQTTLSTVLLAINKAHAQATGADPGARHDLAALLKESSR